MQQVQKTVLTIIVFAERDGEVMSAFRSKLKAIAIRPRMELFYMLPNRSNFLKSLLDNCSEMSKDEVESRTCACKDSHAATLVCLIGNKRQLMLFPQERDLVDAFVQAAVGGKVRKRKSRALPPTTGSVLGSALGYENSSASEDESDTEEEKEEEEERKNGVVQSSVGGPVQQVASSFGNWLERLADGSLRRWTISQWPDWT